MKQSMKFSNGRVLSAVLLGLATSVAALADPGSNDTGTKAGHNTMIGVPIQVGAQSAACDAATDAIMPLKWEAAKEWYWERKHYRETRAAGFKLLAQKIADFRRYLEADKTMKPLIDLYRAIPKYDVTASEKVNEANKEARRVALYKISRAVTSLLDQSKWKEKEAAGLRKVKCSGMVAWQSGYGLWCRKPIRGQKEYTAYFGWAVETVYESTAPEVYADIANTRLFFEAADDPFQVDDDRSVSEQMRISDLLEPPVPDYYSEQAIVERNTRGTESIPVVLREMVLKEISYACDSEFQAKRIEQWAQSELDKASVERTAPSNGSGGAPAVDPNSGAGGAPAQ